jgi:hypothetical protein
VEKIEAYAGNPASQANNVKALQGRDGIRLRVGILRAPILTTPRRLWRNGVNPEGTADNTLTPVLTKSTQPNSLATWRSGYAADCKSVHTGSIPVVASNKINQLGRRGSMLSNAPVTLR